MSNRTLTLVQEVFFDLSDLINSGEMDDIALKGFQEFETLKEFLEEQKAKLREIEAGVEEALAPRVDTQEHLDVVWNALEAYREDLIPEGDKQYDEIWGDICTAMACITEDLGLEVATEEGERA